MVPRLFIMGFLALLPSADAGMLHSTSRPLLFAISKRHLQLQGSSPRGCVPQRRACPLAMKASGTPECDHLVRRRSLLAMPLAIACLSSVSPGFAAEVLSGDEVQVSEDDTRLMGRLAPGALLEWPEAKGINFIDDRQLYWPPWMFGEFDVVASTPSGGSESGAFAFGFGFAAGPPSPTNKRYRARYFSTLADTAENNFKVQMGLGVPTPEIIEDRAFNLLALKEAYEGQRPDGASYDPRTDPTLITLTTAAGARSVRMLTRIGGKPKGAPSPLFFCSELGKIQGVGKEEGLVEVISRYQLQKDGSVEGTRKVVVYKRMQGPASKAAIDVFEYNLSLKRVTGSDGSCCVDTPKGYNQCQPPNFWS